MFVERCIFVLSNLYGWKSIPKWHITFEPWKALSATQSTSHQRRFSKKNISKHAHFSSYKPSFQRFCLAQKGWYQDPRLTNDFEHHFFAVASPIFSVELDASTSSCNRFGEASQGRLLDYPHSWKRSNCWGVTCASQRVQMLQGHCLIWQVWNVFETVQQAKIVTSIAWINACQPPLMALLHIPKASSSNLADFSRRFEALKPCWFKLPSESITIRWIISEFPTHHLGPVSLLSLPKNQHHCQPEKKGSQNFWSSGRMWNVVVAPQRRALQQPPRRTSSPLGLVGGKAFKVWTSSVTVKTEGGSNRKAVFNHLNKWKKLRKTQKIRQIWQIWQWPTNRILWASCCEE